MATSEKKPVRTPYVLTSQTLATPAQLAQMYKNGSTIQEIASETGGSFFRVHYQLLKQGVTMRSTGKKPIPPAVLEEIVAKYRTGEVTLALLGMEYGRSPAALSRALSAVGANRRVKRYFTALRREAVDLFKFGESIAMIARKQKRPYSTVSNSLRLERLSKKAKRERRKSLRAKRPPKEPTDV